MHLHIGPNVLLHYFPTQYVSALKCTTNIILQLTMTTLLVTANKTRKTSGQKLLSKQSQVHMQCKISSLEAHSELSHVDHV